MAHDNLLEGRRHRLTSKSKDQRMRIGRCILKGLASFLFRIAKMFYFNADQKIILQKLGINKSLQDSHLQSSWKYLLLRKPFRS